MFGEVGIIIGQILSFVAVATGFISFQMKSAKGVLIFQIVMVQKALILLLPLCVYQF